MIASPPAMAVTPKNSQATPVRPDMIMAMTAAAVTTPGRLAG